MRAKHTKLAKSGRRKRGSAHASRVKKDSVFLRPDALAGHKSVRVDASPRPHAAPRRAGKNKRLVSKSMFEGKKRMPLTKRDKEIAAFAKEEAALREKVAAELVRNRDIFEATHPMKVWASDSKYDMMRDHKYGARASVQRVHRKKGLVVSVAP